MVLTLLLMALLIGCAIKFKFIPFGMMALSADRDTAERDGRTFNYPVAASTKIYAGGLVVLNSAGNAAPGSEATGLVCAGRAEETVDNGAGQAADLNVTVKEGTFRFANSAASDEITKAEIGDACYIVDDATVAKTVGSGRSVAGYVVDVDSEGVWVKVQNILSAAGGLVAANNLSDVASAATSRANLAANKVALTLTVATLVGSGVYRVVSPVAGTIKKIYSVIEGALTTGDATLTGKINTTAITNGVITITQAGSAAGDVDVATPTAANVLSIGDAISVTVGGTNATASLARVTIYIET